MEISSEIVGSEQRRMLAMDVVNAIEQKPQDRFFIKDCEELLRTIISDHSFTSQEPVKKKRVEVVDIVEIAPVKQANPDLKPADMARIALLNPHFFTYLTGKDLEVLPEDVLHSIRDKILNHDEARAHFDMLVQVEIEKLKIKKEKNREGEERKQKNSTPKNPVDFAPQFSFHNPRLVAEMRTGIARLFYGYDPEAHVLTRKRNQVTHLLEESSLHEGGIKINDFRSTKERVAYIRHFLSAWEQLSIEDKWYIYGELTKNIQKKPYVMDEILQHAKKFKSSILTIKEDIEKELARQQDPLGYETEKLCLLFDDIAASYPQASIDSKEETINEKFARNLEAATRIDMRYRLRNILRYQPDNVLPFFTLWNRSTTTVKQRAFNQMIEAMERIPTLVYDLVADAKGYKSNFLDFMLKEDIVGGLVRGENREESGVTELHTLFNKYGNNTEFVVSALEPLAYSQEYVAMPVETNEEKIMRSRIFQHMANGNIRFIPEGDKERIKNDIDTWVTHINYFVQEFPQETANITAIQTGLYLQLRPGSVEHAQELQGYFLQKIAQHSTQRETAIVDSRISIE